jgi:carbamate kinase
MRLVVALGGNALHRRDDVPHSSDHQHILREAVEAIAALAHHHEIVVTHGNGPQVGLLALQAAANGMSSDPLDVLVAESEGMIGYLIERELAAALPDRDIATLLTQVEVDPGDPGFAAPSKPIGPHYSADEARRLAEERSWTIMRDGTSYRRAVPSPEPQRIRELSAIRILLEAGTIVICSGGGGIPIVVSSDGSIRGVEAVIDKDLSAALLAERLAADALLLLTDVAAVSTDWGNPAAPLIARASPEQLREFHFAPGSMGPKAEGACRFVERTGGIAGIGALRDAAAILAGTAGTMICRTREPMRYHA